MAGRSVLVALIVVTCISNQARANLKHRYSFSEQATANASGVTIVDSVSGANGIVKGAGSSTTGSELVLPGGSSTTQAYVDLPNHLISVLTNATFEAWYTINSAQAWGRVFDFGSTDGGVMGELTGPGGTGTALDVVYFSPQRSVNILQQRFSVGRPGVGYNDYNSEFPQVLGEKYHAAMVIDANGAGLGMATMSLYINGVLAPDAENGANPVPIPHQLADIDDVNNWLGRSNWTADLNFSGSYDEFRIYDEALSSEQVAQSFANGPNIVPEPACLTLLLAAGVCGTPLCWYKLSRNRRRRNANNAIFYPEKEAP